MSNRLALRESFQIALQALRANKARGVLTTLGIVIGIVAVVVTMTAANGLQNRFRESFASVCLIVERQGWLVYRQLMSITIIGVFFLQPGRIGQEYA